MMPATARLAILVVVVISPQPVTPSSVRTSTKKYSPQKVPAAFTSHGTSFVIFMISSHPSLVFAPKQHRLRSM